MPWMKRRELDCLFGSSSPWRFLRRTTKPQGVDEAPFPQNTTPKGQFKVCPSRRPVDAIPPEVSTGVIDRYPKLGQCQSLKPFQARPTPPTERRTRNIKPSNSRKAPPRTYRPNLPTLPEKKEEEERKKKPLESQSRDDSYRVKFIGEIPSNYPFKGRASSYLLDFQTLPKDGFPTSHSRSDAASERDVITPSAGHPMMAEEHSNTETSRPSASNTGVSIMSDGTDTSHSEDDAKSPDGQWQNPGFPSGDEFNNISGPLPSVIPAAASRPSASNTGGSTMSDGTNISDSEDDAESPDGQWHGPKFPSWEEFNKMAGPLPSVVPDAASGLSAFNTGLSTMFDGTDTPDSGDETKSPDGQWHHPKLPIWEEFSKMVDPLPSVIPDAHGFSSQKEFLPFLASANDTADASEDGELLPHASEGLTSRPTSVSLSGQSMNNSADAVCHALLEYIVKNWSSQAVRTLYLHTLGS